MAKMFAGPDSRTTKQKIAGGTIKQKRALARLKPVG
jgi:hypothetical protein